MTTTKANNFRFTPAARQRLNELWRSLFIVDVIVGARFCVGYVGDDDRLDVEYSLADPGDLFAWDRNQSTAAARAGIVCRYVEPVTSKKSPLEVFHYEGEKIRARAECRAMTAEWRTRTAAAIKDGANG